MIHRFHLAEHRIHPATDLGAMALEQSLPVLLSSLQSSIESAVPSLPDHESILPSVDGISLLDVKTELLLSYLQNLVFLILVKLRNHKSRLASNGDNKTHDVDSKAADEDLSAAVVNKLVELRVYLERGVRPLEGRMKYQIDKVLAAAENASRSTTSKPAKLSREPKRSHRKTTNGASQSDSSNASEASDASGSELSGSDDEDEEGAEIDELAYRPNPAAFAQLAQPQRGQTAIQPRGTAAAKPDGIYRPPKITPTVLPTTDSLETSRARKAKPLRSHAVDDYIATELSSAPTAEPSVGSTITAGGRSNKTEKQREKDAERQAYEETNFIRLPKEAKVKGRGRGDAGTMGEFSLGGLGAVGDRVVRATERREAKRGRETVDGGRGDGLARGTLAGGGKRRKFGR